MIDSNECFRVYLLVVIIEYGLVVVLRGRELGAADRDPRGARARRGAQRAGLDGCAHAHFGRRADGDNTHHHHYSLSFI